MWPFSKKINLEESGIFNGFTDWHSHILPGVDDGIKTMDESLEVLREYEALGFKKVWLTPHIMEDYPNETEALKKKFEELKNNWNGKLEISLAAENMLDNLFEERLQTNDFLPIGENGDHLLVETSYYTPPYAMDEMIEEAQKKGYYIILAHPERYRYMDEKDYLKWKNKELLFQMNILSLVGAYGETARKKAEWLLSKGIIDKLGTDIHSFKSFIHHKRMKGLDSSTIKKIPQ
ncbi:MAG: capsular biosynthesis protein [Muribaculaceae bacterium]|nr:capsular biosynthesis protein [Muribaculaceae bacterium]